MKRAIKAFITDERGTMTIGIGLIGNQSGTATPPVIPGNDVTNLGVTVTNSAVTVTHTP